ncbi:hypothetical protein RhiirC2_855014 [Rhizophagus irregularis]|uniref:Uncharacterized protein n=1 Tax=Rhizophagus irregularis TaxID=588596 RepID=A0A2N1MP80_9GLOM|nr:hypothetical protein RhiirC2_855014 [Rhizophagus irregularis]
MSFKLPFYTSCLDLFENGFFLANIVGHAFGSVGNAIVFLIYESWNPKKFIDNDNISNLENNYIINEVKIDNDNINIEVNIESSRLNLDFDKILKNVRKLVTSGIQTRQNGNRMILWGSELDALIKILKPKTKNHNKVLSLKRNLEGRRASRHRASATCIICYEVLKNVEILMSIVSVLHPTRWHREEERPDRASATCTFAMRKKLKSEKNNGKEEESKKKRKAVEEYSVRRKIDASDNVKAKDIELWRVNDPFEEFKENSILLNNIEVKEKLFPTVKISSVFDDDIPELKIHFIVKVPANIEGYILPELESNDIISKKKDENVKEICKMPCPSTSANPVFEEKAVPILWEYKNEIGTGGKDPSIQGICGYAKYWAQSQTKKIRNSSCCPSIILAIAGPWICVLGAVYP